MTRVYFFLLGMVAGALLIYATMHFHLVRAQDGFHVVDKQPPRLTEAYVDVRSFGMTDWGDHPQLATAVMEADKPQLLGDSARGAVQDGINQIMPGWPAPTAPQ
jgi:hypothetical protein